MYNLSALLDLVIKTAIATIVGCVAYVYVRTIKDPDYRVNFTFHV